MSSVRAQQKGSLASGMAYDGNGNLFIADASRNQVFEVQVSGVLNVVAGTGDQGFEGDSGSAASALLNRPQGIAIGQDGTLFIADSGNRRVRAVKNGITTTVAGTGKRGNSGDGGPAVSATFDRPTALGVTGDGNLLICDTGNHRVRLVAKGLIQSFAGTGTQGFAGDGGAASKALLDSPEGLAALPDGRVVIADSHNHRLRVIGADGIIATFAGTGARGYSGDGGPATAATLFLPRGVSATGAGGVLFADSNNQRIRFVDASGHISTLAGNGVQGAADDVTGASTATLNVPKGIAVSPFGTSAFGDYSGPALKAVAANGNVYLVPAPPSRKSTVAISVPATTVYGQTSAVVMVTAAAPPHGKVEVQDAGVAVGEGLLANGNLTFTLSAVSVGNHVLTAHYAGDGINPAADSASVPLVVQRATAIVKATPASVAYGESFPPFSGSVNGILPQDASSIAVVYSTSATPVSGVGTYAIDAKLTGAAGANYSLSKDPASGALTIHRANSTTVTQGITQTSYTGLPLQLNARVAPQFAGTPTGQVEFLDNGAVVAKADTQNGSASAVFVSPAAGSHTITAAYGGDANFLASTSSPLSIGISSIPDFTVAAAPSTQSVQAGLVAIFVLSVKSVGDPFTGSVTFSASGLPAGAQASFSPKAVVPGSAGSSTTLSIQVPVARAEAKPINLPQTLLWSAAVPLLLFVRRRRRRLACSLASFLLLLGITGCGARTVGFPTSTTSQSFPIQVTATSTNLAGAVVTHATTITLIVQ